MTEAFKDLKDENVWKRPAPGLLSIGEMAGHMAYWEAVRFGGDATDGGSERDLSNCRIKSPLLDPRFSYYTSTLETTPSGGQFSMSAAQVLSELLRVHTEAIAIMKERNPDPAAKAPHWHSNYEELLQYMIFHAAYHTGQMYSARHLLGETPPDN